MPEPWSEVNNRYIVNQLVQATITNLVEFGAFARIENGVEGLIHISELSDKPVNHPNEVVKVGDVVTVKILRIDAEHRRLGLSLKGAKEEEFDWAPAADEEEGNGSEPTE
jgi:small subunit ribosomal protein S1